MRILHPWHCHLMFQLLRLQLGLWDARNAECHRMAAVNAKIQTIARVERVARKELMEVAKALPKVARGWPKVAKGRPKVAKAQTVVDEVVAVRCEPIDCLEVKLKERQKRGNIIT